MNKTYIRKSDGTEWTLVWRYAGSQYPYELRSSTMTIHVTYSEFWDDFEEVQ